MSPKPLSLLAPVSHPLGNASAAGIGDMNGDGKPDLVVAAASSINVLINEGNGAFGAPVAYSASPPLMVGFQETVQSFALADLNGDGHLDVAVAGVFLGMGIPFADLTVLLGDGGGGLGVPTSVRHTEGRPYVTMVSAADMNADGKADLISITSGSRIEIWFNGGNAVFRAGDAATGPGLNPSALAVGDVNGDGSGDAILSVADPGLAVGVFLNDGSGTLSAPTAYPTGPDSMGLPRVPVALGDLTADGSPDLIVARSDGGITSVPTGAVSILLNDGRGAFGAAATVATGVEPSAVAVGDLNGDGQPDVIFTDWNVSNERVSVLLNNGHGTFAAALNYAAGSRPSSLAVGDVNGDGKRDLIVINGFSTEGSIPGVSVLLNASP